MQHTERVHGWRYTADHVQQLFPYTLLKKADDHYVNVIIENHAKKKRTNY